MSAIPAGCTDGGGLLAPSDAEGMGAELGRGWEVGGAARVLEVRLADFAAALGALNALAEIAEEENHHPDLTISDYRCLTVSLTTHDVGGLTANDFVVARRADRMLAGDA